jgi:hypothetical protein
MNLPPKPDYIHNLEFIRILSPYVLICGSVKKRSVLDVAAVLVTCMAVYDEGAHSVLTLDLDKRKFTRHIGFARISIIFSRYLWMLKDGI